MYRLLPRQKVSWCSDKVAHTHTPLLEFGGGLSDMCNKPVNTIWYVKMDIHFNMTKNNTLQVVFLSDDLRSPLRIQSCLWTGHRCALFGRNTCYDRCIDQMLLCVRSGCNIENQPWFGHHVSFCFSDSKCIMYDAELVLYFSLNSCDSLL